MGNLASGKRRFCIYFAWTSNLLILTCSLLFWRPALATAAAVAADPAVQSASGLPVSASRGQTEPAPAQRGEGGDQSANRGPTDAAPDWVPVAAAAFLAMFLQAGFALVATGLCRAKNAAHMVTMSLLSYALAGLGFWVGGFRILCGHEGLFFGPPGNNARLAALFLLQAVFAATVAAIPVGAMAERWRLKNFLLYGVWAGLLPYAIVGRWVWGGGWLASLGRNFGLGHGQVDFAGSLVLHLCGGMIALAGIAVIGPRLGKYGPPGRARPIQGHNLVYVVLGTFILAFGWFGLNAGMSLASEDGRIAVVAVNTFLASAAATVAGCLVMYWILGKPDPSLLCNSLLAGLVAIAGPCAFVSAAAAVVIGAVAGVLAVWAVFFFENTARLDDPVGALSVHAVNGAWGVLSLGLFANGSFGAGWNGVHRLLKAGVAQTITSDGTSETAARLRDLLAAGWTDQGVTGAVGTWFGAPANDGSQLAAQCVGLLACVLFVGCFAWIWFRLSNLLVPMRVAREDELAGLDRAEVGVECYPDYHLTDKSSPRIF